MIIEKIQKKTSLIGRWELIANSCERACALAASFKSKRYRDKLRLEVRELERVLPVERMALHRRLDSQTIYRLTVAYFRMKLFLKGEQVETQT